MKRLPRRRRLAAEPLEARLNMATLTVNSAADNTDFDEQLTLREAIALVNAVGDPQAAVGGELSAGEAAQVNTAEPFGTNDTILFDAALNGGTINLNSRFVISRSVSINGPGAPNVILNGQDLVQHFFLDGRTNGAISVNISRLRLGSGRADSSGGPVVDGIDSGTNGGSVFNDSANVTFDGTEFVFNSASEDGGAIYNLGGFVTVRDSLFSSNFAIQGGAILNDANNSFAGLMLTQSTVGFTNTYSSYSAAIHNRSAGSVDLIQSTLAQNNNGGAYFAAAGSFTSIANTVVIANGDTEIFSEPGANVAAHHSYFGNGAGVQGEFTVTHGQNFNVVGAQTSIDGVLTTDSQTYTPTSNSPLLDAGDEFSATWTLDQLGQPRVVDGPDLDTTATVDIGAVEFQNTEVATTTTLTSSAPNGSVVGQLVTFTATVSAATGIPTGTVVFSIDGNPTSPMTLVNGQAVFSTSTLSLGAHTVTATYSGAAGVAASATVNPFAQLVKESTTVALQVARLPNNALRLQAQVTSDGGGSPAGVVQFFVDGALAGTVPLVGSSASFNTGTLSPGTHQVSAKFSGSGLYADATSPTATINLGPLVVDTLVDENDGNHTVGDVSLREALALANLFPGADEITFSPSLGAAPTLTLTQGRLSVTSDVTIAGPGANTLAISGNNASQIFYIDGQTNGPVTAEIRDLTMTAGKAAGGGVMLDIYDSGLYGGALLNNGGDLTLRRVAVTNNSAPNGHAGGLYNWTGGGIMNVIDSTVSGNTALEEGGGIINWDSTLNVTNSTISGNSATLAAGGIGNYFGTVTLTNVTITGNRAQNGGGMVAEGNETLRNSVIAGNLDSTGTQPNDFYFGHFVESAAHTLVGDPASAPGGIVHGDNGNLVGQDDDNNPNTPRVVWPIAEILNTTLANNGGPTKTHALVSGSPAIDAGANALAVGSTDQRGDGFARIRGSAVDIGAFEANPNSPPTTVIPPPTPFARENSPGFVVGTIEVIDPDSGETFTYVVSDNRFEVVGGVLMVRPDVHLQPGGPITFTIVATDSAGQSTPPATVTINIRLGSVATPYHNGAERSNVDRIDGVDAADILWTTYFYRLYPDGVLPAAPDNDVYQLVDVTGDGLVDPQDILYTIVDFIAAQGGGEGEAAITAAAEAVPPDAELHDAALAWLLWADAEAKRKERAKG